MDLRKRFRAGAAEAHKKNRIVVVELDDRSIGLIVSSASEVLRIPPSEIEDPHNVFREGELDYITGVGTLNGRLVILLDLKKTVQQGELPALDGAHGFEEPLAAGSVART